MPARRLASACGRRSFSHTLRNCALDHPGCLLVLLIMEKVELEKLLCLLEKMEDSIAPSQRDHRGWIEGAVQERDEGRGEFLSALKEASCEIRVESNDSVLEVANMREG